MMKATMMILSLVVSSSAGALSPSVECFKQAMSDAAVIPYYKTAAKVGYEHALEDKISKLCGSTTSASLPVNCYKDAINDSAVLNFYKNAARNGYEQSLEDAALDLCAAK